MKSYEIEPQSEATPGETLPEDAQQTEEEPSSLATTTAEEASPVVQESDELDEAVRQRGQRKLVPPTGERLWTWIGFGGVLLLGAVLRFWNLGAKPLHHDESLHAYYSLQLLHNMQNWIGCFNPQITCYRYDPLLHGPFQFHFIALVYQISQWVGAPDHGVSTTTVRILAATLGTVIVGLPFFLRDYLGKWGAWLACFLLAVSPSMVYFSRFAREDIYMACFTLLMVVSVARYVRTRRMRWIVLAAAAFSFSYATKEATFLSIAVFGSFFGALLAWELGVKIPLRALFGDSRYAYLLPRTAASVILLVYIIIAGVMARALFAWLKYLSIYSTSAQTEPYANLFVQHLKDLTVAIVPWLGILLGVYVLTILGREMFGKLPLPGRHGLAAHVDPQRQPLLDSILTMQWTHWFFAILVAWSIFLALYTVLFTNIKGGIGDGIWAGLYYWIQQQQVARGGQPWYYYLMLIPLYEQIGVVFGLVGVIRCVAQPTRFRLFMVYWFLGNLFIYSWAAEKMPWLMIHITMPMMILAAIGLEPIVVTLARWAQQWFARQTQADAAMAHASETLPEQGEQAGGVDTSETLPEQADPAASKPMYRPLPPLPARPQRVGPFVGGAALLGFVFAVLLLLPTVHNMFIVTYVDAADGPHEMMIYVQTTTDINIVMAKVDQLDQQYYGGKHTMPIALTDDATWPYVWYLRDYTNLCLSFPSGCSATANNYPVIITGGDNPSGYETQYGTQGDYNYHQYHMRSWWDEGYKPPPCLPSKSNSCDGQATYGGVGLGLWLDYGDNPPPNARFNLGLAAQHVWQWEWYRRPFGDTGGAYDMVLFIRKDLHVTP